VLALSGQEGEILLRRLDSVGVRDVALEPLDVILEVTGRRQPEAGGDTITQRVGRGGVRLGEAMFDLEPGSIASIKAWRGGGLVSVDVVVAPADLQLMEREHHVSCLGARFEAVPWRLRLRANFDGEGLLLGGLEPGSAAGMAGLARNDVVSRVLLRRGDELEEVRLASLDDLRRRAADLDAAIAEARRSGAPLLVGFEVFNLDERRHEMRILRLGGLASRPDAKQASPP
jgi:hypothetical protein